MSVVEKEKSALTAEEEILIKAQKIEQNKSENNVFTKQLDKYFEGKMPSNEVINVCSTPNILKLFGSTARKVVINQSDLQNSVSQDKHSKYHTEGHGIDKKEIYKLSETIRSPIMLLTGNKKKYNWAI